MTREMSQNTTYGRCTLGLLTRVPQQDCRLRGTQSYLALGLYKTLLHPTTHDAY